MVRFVADQSRIVAERKQVSVSVVLPVEAVHNLLLASELSLASPVRGVDSSNEEDRSNWTIHDVLASNTGFRFDQKSLDLAMQDVAEQIRDGLPGLPFEFSIEIVGTDLEQEGITRNQQIRGFGQSSRALSEILTELVMKANPFQQVTQASDAGQKLVWATSPTLMGKILITTRSAARKKGLTLPKNFNP